MTWLIVILGVLFFFLCWLLLAPIVMVIDTRQPVALLKWMSIGSARIWYDEEWWVSMRIPFYQRTWKLYDLMKRKPKEKIANKKKEPTNKLPGSKKLKKFWLILSSFRVRKWALAIDTGNPIRNAQMYPLNFYPGARHHFLVNYNDENYLVLEIFNRPLQMIIAFLR